MPATLTATAQGTSLSEAAICTHSPSLSTIVSWVVVAIAVWALLICITLLSVALYRQTAVHLKLRWVMLRARMVLRRSTWEDVVLRQSTDDNPNGQVR